MKLTGIKEAAQRWNESYKAGQFEPYSNWNFQLFLTKDLRVYSTMSYGGYFTADEGEQEISLYRRNLNKCRKAKNGDWYPDPDLRKTSSWLRECVESEIERQKALESHWAE